MIKCKFVKVTLRLGESQNREHFSDRTCMLILKGGVMVFDERGKPVFRLDAGDANVFNGYHEFTITAFADGTELIVV